MKNEVTQEELGEALDRAWNHAILKAWAEGKTGLDAVEEILSEVTGCMCPACRQRFEEAMKARYEGPIRQTLRKISARLDAIERDLNANKNDRYPAGEGQTDTQEMKE